MKLLHRELAPKELQAIIFLPKSRKRGNLKKLKEFEHAFEKSWQLAKNSDILIHDAHFTPEDLSLHKGWGHSTWKHAVDVAKSSNSKQLVLFHHNPIYEDSKLDAIESIAQENFKETISAKQGLVIYL